MLISYSESNQTSIKFFVVNRYKFRNKITIIPASCTKYPSVNFESYEIVRNSPNIVTLTPNV